MRMFRTILVMFVFCASLHAMKNRCGPYFVALADGGDDERYREALVEARKAITILIRQSNQGSQSIRESDEKLRKLVGAAAQPEIRRYLGEDFPQDQISYRIVLALNDVLSLESDLIPVMRQMKKLHNQGMQWDLDVPADPLVPVDAKSLGVKQTPPQIMGMYGKVVRHPDLPKPLAERLSKHLDDVIACDGYSPAAPLLAFARGLDGFAADIRAQREGR